MSIRLRIPAGPAIAAGLAVLALAMLPLAVLPLACGGGVAAPTSGLLVTLDTTRADALGCYGGRPGVSVHLDELAEESLVFTRAHTVAPLTTPSHASMLTGLYPPRHGVRDNAHRPLGPAATTLAERAREAGLQTAAFVSAVVLAEVWGLDQGFEHYDVPADSRSLATEHMVERSADQVVERALAWLRGRDRSRPFFLWVHFFDPHAPYEPPPAALRQAGGNPYLGEVAAMDRACGRLFDELRGEGALDDTLVVVAGDHGEALGAHGEPTHSVLCYQEVLRVPLLVRDARVGPGRRDDVVSVVDVLPTFLEGLGLGPLADPVDGRSLLSPPGSQGQRGVYFESYDGFLNYGWSPIAGWLEGERKYLHGSAPELYDLARDPLEATNLLERGEEARSHREAIARLAELPVLPTEDVEVDRDAREDVRALGYGGAADAEQTLPHPLEPTGRMDARERMGELARFYEATLLFNRGEAGPAIEGMRAVLAENPRNVAAASVLASFLLTGGRDAQAIEVLLSIPEEERDRLNVQDHLGHAYENLGRLDQALVHFRRALERKPGDPHQTQDVERVLGLLEPPPSTDDEDEH